MNTLFRLLFLAISLAFSFGCAPLQRVQSMEHYLDRKISVVGSDQECWIIFRGAVTADAAYAFRLAANDADSRKCATKWVWLESPGGLIIPAMEIGRIIRDRGYNTTLGNGAGRCSSSCGLMFISGVKRVVPSVFVESKIGFHQIYSKDRDGRLICQDTNSDISKLFLSFARDMLASDAAEKFYKNAMGTECTAMTYFGPKELIDVGIATGTKGPDIL